MRVLVVGGSGYLGQFLVNKLAACAHEVVYTYLSTSLSAAAAGAGGVGVRCDLTDGAAIAGVVQAHGPFDAVVNTAALSQPGACEADSERSRAVNVPHSLLAALHAAASPPTPAASPPLLIHLSTDQVYPGTAAHSRETTTTAPVNVYGASKLEAERTVQARWHRHVILRSSIIVGPQPPVPVSRPLFVQFIEEKLRSKEPATFFDDEFRSPVMVSDIARIVEWLVSGSDGADAAVKRVLNMGGPNRLSRYDMAAAVAAHCGLGMDSVTRGKSADVKRAAASPLDISMDSSELQRLLPFPMTPFAAGLAEVLGPAAGGTEGGA